ncbi:MAG: hypothetical protein IJ538_04640 [Clostridia bacterium]|nr:hypothetical protein [Clostridia bacterium]
MKKFITIILAVVITVGIVWLGVFIFRSTTVDSVEIVGDIQTLYLVDDENVNFQDAILKVKYKNGNVKELPLKSTNVEIQGFSTGKKEKQDEMKIIYKGFVNKINYTVMARQLYYIKSEKTFEYDGTKLEEKNFNADNATVMFKFEKDGKLRYYTRGGSELSSYEKPYYLNDGLFDSNYNYSISGNTLTVNAGAKEYSIVPKYAGSDSIQFVSREKSGSKTIEYIIAINTTEKSGIEPILSSETAIFTDGVEVSEPISFKIGQTIESSKKNIYLVIKSTSNSSVRTVLVKITDELLNNGGEGPRLDTSATADAKVVYFNYPGLSAELAFNYKVIV